MKLEKLFNEESGQGMVEYGLILALIAIAAMGTLGILGNNTIQPMYEKIESMVPAAK